MFIVGVTSFYGLTMVTTFIAQSQLYNKLKNQLYVDKYIETEKPRKVNFKETFSNTIKFLLPVYNVASSVYYLHNFNKYYDKVKDELLNNGYLEKVAIKETIDEPIVENQESEVEENKIDYIWGNDIQEEIEYVRPKKLVKTMDRIQ